MNACGNILNHGQAIHRRSAENMRTVRTKFLANPALVRQVAESVRLRGAPVLRNRVRARVRCYSPSFAKDKISTSQAQRKDTIRPSVRDVAATRSHADQSGNRAPQKRVQDGQCAEQPRSAIASRSFSASQPKASPDEAVRGLQTRVHSRPNETRASEDVRTTRVQTHSDQRQPAVHSTRRSVWRVPYRAGVVSSHGHQSGHDSSSLAQRQGARASALAVAPAVAYVIGRVVLAIDAALRAEADPFSIDFSEYTSTPGDTP